MNPRSVLLASLVVALLFFTGCDSRRDQAVADSAASIYEAAAAIDLGVDPAMPAQAIRLQAWAIIQATGHTYAPAAREFAHKEGKP